MFGSSALPTGSYSRFGREDPNETKDIRGSCFGLYVEHVCPCRRADERKALAEQFEVEAN